jgi:hypothetical protein
MHTQYRSKTNVLDGVTSLMLLALYPPSRHPLGHRMGLDVSTMITCRELVVPSIVRNSTDWPILAVMGKRCHGKLKRTHVPPYDTSGDNSN